MVESRLDDKNKEVIQEINGLLADKTPSSRKTVIKALTAYTAKRLYTLSKNSPAILQLCEDKKESDELNKALVQSYHYSSLRLPKENVISIDKKITVTPYQQFMGYYLVCEATEEKSSKAAAELLDIACDKYNNYQALFMRMELALKAIKEAPKKDLDYLQQVNATIEQLLADADKIGNLYYSLGYFKAADVLLEAITAYLDYFKLEGIKLIEERYAMDSSGAKVRGLEKPKEVKPHEIIAMRDKLLERMLVCFYLSYASSTFHTSVDLNLAINRGEVLLKKLGSWQEGQDFLIKMLPSVATDARALFGNVRKCVDAQVNSYPEVFKKVL